VHDKTRVDARRDREAVFVTNAVGERCCLKFESVATRTHHTPKLSSPANGSAEWPPDDRLRRVIQYSEALVIEPRSRSVLDTPLEPVIGLAEGETRWRGMTILSHRPRMPLPVRVIASNMAADENVVESNS
jgi:hypothetical protein